MKIKLLVLFCFFAMGAFCQKWEWAYSPGLNSGKSLTIDANGNVYTLVSSQALFAGDSKVQKHNQNGVLLWEFNLETMYAQSITCDKNGNIYITGGIYQGKFYSTSAAEYFSDITPGHTLEIFLARYDSNGNLVWVKRSGYLYGMDARGCEVKTDTSGNPHIIGNAYYESEHGSDLYNCFIKKYDATGNLTWQKDTQWKGYVIGTSFAIDSHGNCYVTGRFTDTAYFDQQSINSTFLYSIFLAKYGADGSVKWVKTEGSNADEAGRIDIDAWDNLYLTGNYTSPSTIGGITVTAPTFTGTPMFVARLDTTGTAYWVKTANSATCGGIKCSEKGDCFVTGCFENNAVFNGTFPAIMQTQKSGEAFAARYSSAGNLIWVVAPSGGPGEVNAGHAIGCDKSDHIYFTGRMTSVTSLGNQSYTVITNGLDKCDAFVAKLTDTSGNLTSIPRLISTKKNFYVHPVPSQDVITIVLKEPIAEVAEFVIIDYTGVTVLSRKIYPHLGGEYHIDLSALPAGTYLLKGSFSDSITTAKIVVSR